jgi:hypothetical protein
MNYKEQSKEELIERIKDLETQLLIETEKSSYLKAENEGYNRLMGYKNDMTYEEKIKHNQEKEKEQRDLENALEENSVKREYLAEIENEERMVDIALEMNELHFECSELFKIIKKGLGGHLSEEEYIDYKKHKRNFYSIITHFHSNFSNTDTLISDISEDEVEEDINKLVVFDVLIKVLKTQKRIYKLDEELKGLSKK